jgi:hypothetical protein
MVPVDARAHPEHGRVIRCDIKPRLAKRSRDIENKAISEKIQRVHDLRHPFVQNEFLNLLEALLDSSTIDILQLIYTLYVT